MSFFRFAAASYSNSAPLIKYITAVDNRAQIFYGHPSSHVKELLEGRVDCALIPVAHLFKYNQLRSLEGIGIAANGCVRSVLLRCKKEVNQIQTILKDPASGTSNILAQLIMEHYFGQSIEMTNDPLSVDAEVVIGDRALLNDSNEYIDLDLAGIWKEFTNLSFVFAVWAIRKDFKNSSEIEFIVNKAADLGIENIETIAKDYQQKMGRTASFWTDYLKQNIHFRLTKNDLDGMELFRSMIGVHKILSTTLN